MNELNIVKVENGFIIEVATNAKICSPEHPLGVEKKMFVFNDPTLLGHYVESWGNSLLKGKDNED